MTDPRDALLLAVAEAIDVIGGSRLRPVQRNKLIDAAAALRRIIREEEIENAR